MKEKNVKKKRMLERLLIAILFWIGGITMWCGNDCGNSDE